MTFERDRVSTLISIVSVLPHVSPGRYKAHPYLSGVVSLALCLILFNGVAWGAGPCTCKDLDNLKEHRDRAAASEEIWKEIFAWARGLHPTVAPPKSNDDLNQKFVQLAGAPQSKWRELIKEGPIKNKQSLKKVAGLNEKGEPVIDQDFQDANCDDVIQAETVHEHKHKDFYLSFPHIFDVVLESRLLRLRSESEVESYRAQKDFLQKKYSDLKQKCSVTKIDPSTKRLLEQALAQADRLNQAENRIFMYTRSGASLN